MEGAKGRSTMHGSSYHLRMAMVIMLRAFTLQYNKKLADFKITMEDPAAGKFDDVVFRYSLPSTPTNFANVCIQAKHKQIPDSVKKVPSIKEATLLTKWNSKAPFSIPMYFVSYLDMYEESLTGSHTYILCTNASVDGYLETYLTVQKHDTDHILSFCDAIGATCYSFRSDREFETLVGELRIASIEKLGQLLASHSKTKEQIPLNSLLLKWYANLLGKCIEKNDSGVFQFNEEFRAAENSTLIGILRSSFQKEYLKQSTKKEVKWEDVTISIDQSCSESILDTKRHSISDNPSYYEKIDEVILKFYEKFMLVCGSLNETELCQKVMEIMPHWVNNKTITYNNLHNMLFDGMIKTIQISLQDLKQHFIATNTNDNFVAFKAFSLEYQESMRATNSLVIVDPNCLKDTELNEFISCRSQYVYRYRCATNLKMNSLIVSQTLALHQYQCLFVDSASLKSTANIAEALYELLEFIAAVDLSTKYIITILGQQEFTVLKAIKDYAKSLKMKLIIVEEPAEDDLSENRLFIRDLTEEARMKLFKQHKLNIFGSIITLDKVVRDDDELNMLFSILDKYDDIEGEKNFDKIKPCFMPRCCVPYYKGMEDREEVEEEITDEMLLSFINEANKFPNVLKRADNVKKHFFINKPGSEKFKYFTWLATTLLRENASLYIMQMNPLQYSHCFRQLKVLDFDITDVTKVIQIFYRFFYMTLPVGISSLDRSGRIGSWHLKSNFIMQLYKEADEKRQKADRMALLLKVSNDKIILDEKEMKISNLQLEDLLGLRLFQSKFNERQFICLLDCFDKIAPEFEEFAILFCLETLSYLDGVKNVYVSTTSYMFTDIAKHVFTMWRLEPFSQKEQILLLIHYLEHEMVVCKINDEDNIIAILKNLYTTSKNSDRDLKMAPLFLRLLVKILLSKEQNNNKVEEQNNAMEILENILNMETKLDQLQIISYFVDEKLRMLNNGKTVTIDFATYNPNQGTKNDEANEKLKRMYSLMAALATFHLDGKLSILSEKEQEEAREFIQEINQGNDKNGFIKEIRDNIPQFTQRVFNDYFAACWLYKNNNSAANRHYIKEILHYMRNGEHFEYGQIWNFYNLMSSWDRKQSDIHLAVIKQSEKQVRDILLQKPSAALETDAMGRYPLHLAVVYPSETIEALLLKNMPVGVLNAKDNLLQWTALDYANKMSYDNFRMEKLIAAGGNESENNFMLGVTLAMRKARLDGLDKKKWYTMPGSNFAVQFEIGGE